MPAQQKPKYGIRFAYTLCRWEEQPQARWRRVEVIAPEFFELPPTEDRPEILGITGHPSFCSPDSLLIFSPKNILRQADSWPPSKIKQPK